MEVSLTKGYWLAKYELTQAEWNEVMHTEPWKGKDWTEEGADYPATFVDWNDATEFCRKFTEQKRLAGRLANDWEYRLPTEAEWERACRARTEKRFSFGADKSQRTDDSSRVFRGGCFSWDASNCGSAIRNCTLPSIRFSFLGFRVALCRVK